MHKFIVWVNPKGKMWTLTFGLKVLFIINKICVFKSRHFLLKWLFKARKVSSHVFVYYGYRFCLFPLFYHWIIELLRQCGIFVFISLQVQIDSGASWFERMGELAKRWGELEGASWQWGELSDIQH